MEELGNKEAEAAVLGTILESGYDGYIDIADMLSPSTFTDSRHQAIFKCIKDAADKNVSIFDNIIISSISEELKLERLVSEKALNEVRAKKASVVNLPMLAGKIRRLEVSRIIYSQMREKLGEVSEFTGDEPIAKILAATEFNLDSLLTSANKYVQIGEGAIEKLKNRVENPVTQIGISTGFPIYDMAIGGGLRNGSINVICARIKVGKSQFLNNVALNISKMGIPVLYLDTEMNSSEQQDRCIANLSDVSISDIETGKFGKNEFFKNKVFRAAEDLINLPYTHITVAGMQFEEQIALISKWVRQNKKIKEDGTIPNVVVFYDYLKLTTQEDMSDNISEHQILGFMMTTLHNLSVRLDFPLMTAGQLNRDGISKESSDAVAGSDRILWLCSNLSFLKVKSEEEIKMDGEEAGNRKLAVIVARHGPGLAERDYINYIMDGSKARITEAITRSQIVENQRGETKNYIPDNSKDESGSGCKKKQTRRKMSDS